MMHDAPLFVVVVSAVVNAAHGIVFRWYFRLCNSNAFVQCRAGHLALLCWHGMINLKLIIMLNMFAETPHIKTSQHAQIVLFKSLFYLMFQSIYN